MESWPEAAAWAERATAFARQIGEASQWGWHPLGGTPYAERLTGVMAKIIHPGGDAPGETPYR